MSRIARTLGLVLALAGAALLAPATSFGSSALVSGGVLTYTAAAGEANHLVISYYTQYSVYVLYDTGVTSITTSGGKNAPCRSYSPQVVYCYPGTFTSIVVHAGDGGSYVEGQLTLTPVTMYAGAGSDTLIGGGGNDTINARNGVAGHVTCGGGTDVVTADPDDTVAADCETVDGGTSPSAPEPPATGGSTDVPPIPDNSLTGPPAPPPIAVSQTPVTMSPDNNVPVSLECPETSVTDCVGTVVLSITESSGSKHKVVAARRVKRIIGKSRRFTIKRGRKASVPVVLSRRGARAFRANRHRRTMKVTATVLLRAEGGTRSVTQTITVRPRRVARPTQTRTRSRR
jgi:Ca2+-binding RTX toxin-like protein